MTPVDVNFVNVKECLVKIVLRLSSLAVSSFIFCVSEHMNAINSIRDLFRSLRCDDDWRHLVPNVCPSNQTKPFSCVSVCACALLWLIIIIVFFAGSSVPYTVAISKSSDTHIHSHAEKEEEEKKIWSFNLNRTWAFLQSVRSINV